MDKKKVFKKLQKKLLRRKELVLNELEEKHEEVSDWLSKHKKDINSLSRTVAETAATSAATGILLLASGSLPLRGVTQAIERPDQASSALTTTKIKAEEEIAPLLAEKLSVEVPSIVEELTKEEKNRITQIISESLGIPVKSELEGFELNTSYGYIGGEQHLYRFPSDNLIRHIRDAREWFMFGLAGIAPNRGAWGYFPNEEYERYYVAAQTFLSPNWSKNPKAAYDWFRFRKVLVVNPKNGESVVAVVGDAGPAEWTGKKYGGSPEVMHDLGLGRGPRKGAVLMFFVDDKENRYPLGPVTKKLT